MRIIDITQELLSCQVYPGHLAPRAERTHDMADGELFNLTNLSMCAHNGTHVDAPAHFIKDGATLEQLPIETFVGECWVARHDGDVTGADAQRILAAARAAGAAERILIAGDATVTADAAREFAQAGVKLVGNESQSVGPVDAPREVHLILLGTGAALLEGLVMDGVEEGRYLLSAAPLNAAGCEGAPCRAVLIKY